MVDGVLVMVRPFKIRKFKMAVSQDCFIKKKKIYLHIKISRLATVLNIPISNGQDNC